MTLGPPGFLFKTTPTQLCCMSPSPSEPPRGSCSTWRCPKEGFLLVWDPQQLKHLQGGLRSREGDDGQVPSSLSAGLGRGAVWKWSCVSTVSREGFPEVLITGVMQSLQLSSAETFVVEIF